MAKKKSKKLQPMMKNCYYGRETTYGTLYAGSAELKKLFSKWSIPLWLHMDVCTLRDNKGNEWVIQNIVPAGVAVRSKQPNGRTFCISPKQILDLALDAGLEKDVNFNQIPRPN